MKRLLRQCAAMRRLSATVLVLASLAVFRPAVALAAPTNDNFSSATVISGLPFSDVVDTTDATTEPGEPAFCYSTSQTVWYSFTPATTTVLHVDMVGTTFYETFSVY